MNEPSKPATTRSVNAMLKRNGIKAELVKGDGYYWFFGDDTYYWGHTSVYVNRVSRLTHEQWLNEWKALVEENQK